MAIDIKAKVDEIVKKLTSDKDLMNKFTKDPTKTLEGLIGVDLPDDQINQLVAGVKAKINLDKLGDVAGKLGGILGKK